MQVDPSLDLFPIGNCAIASLVDRRARHVWCCYPRLDGDPIFNALVNGSDPKAGFMDVVLADLAQTHQAYRANTAILETTMMGVQGQSLRVIDFAPRYRRMGRSFRSPLLVRRIEPLSGWPRVTIRIRPTFNYGSAPPIVTFGSNHVRYAGGADVIRVTTNIGPSFILQENSFLLDRPITLFMGLDEGLSEDPDTLGRKFLELTEEYWTEWVRNLAVPFDWQSQVIRSAITLKLCSFEETGAIVAALTTSIPEAPASTRNWDYRYCWLRDAFFTVTALNRLGATRTMEGFVRFVLNAVLDPTRPDIAPLYPITRSTTLEERTAADLSGYLDQGPVRVGNAAAYQRQFDCYGSVILAAAQIFWDERLGAKDTEALYGQLRGIGERARLEALIPDSGPWEYRGRVCTHTFSAAMCWAALHRLGLIAERVGHSQEAAHWRSHAQAIRQAVLKRATTAQGWISGVLDSQIVDASVLLLPEIGFISAKDETFLRSLRVMEQRLMRNGFIMRYAEADDFGVPETAFLVCTFWYADALASVGRRQEAGEIFARALSCRNNAGLLSEDFDPVGGRLWGNYPQTYSLVGLILSATRLSRSWEEGLWRAS